MIPKRYTCVKVRLRVGKAELDQLWQTPRNALPPSEGKARAGIRPASEPDAFAEHSFTKSLMKVLVTSSAGRGQALEGIAPKIVVYEPEVNRRWPSSPLKWFADWLMVCLCSMDYRIPAAIRASMILGFAAPRLVALGLYKDKNAQFWFRSLLAADVPIPPSRTFDRWTPDHRVTDIRRQSMSDFMFCL